MVFNKEEIISLASGREHIIVDIIEYEDIYYYYVCEIDKGKNKVIDSLKIISTVNENGNTFVKTIKGDLEVKLKNIFNERLKINN